MSMFFNILSMGGFDPDYQALLDYYSTNSLALPGAAKRTQENAFMAAYKAAFGASTIAATPTLQMLMFKSDAASGATLVNWHNPGTRNATNSGATFTSDLGWNSDGASTYITSGLTIGNINQADFTILTRAYTNQQNSANITGAGDNPGVGGAETIHLNTRNVSDNLQFRASGNATAVNVSNTDARVRVAFGRTDASNVHHSLNGASFTGTAILANASETTSTDITILVYTGGGGPAGGFWTAGVSYRIVTSRKLTDAEVAAVDAALVNYLA